MMMISRNQVRSLFMILLSILAINFDGALGARILLLNEKVIGQDLEKVPVWNNESSNNNINGDEGFFATINREVPSCPDPLHNR
ncbi:hypothetical protein L484_001168 [Morus notabilis]|uniref:Uncharacterized protein n=1 Tax=Morus notabilis TaxID=981085 RepID=W9RWR7_9ROSA|nr:hypothetical protein L484_001168 [Morus notabilis]